MAQLGLRGARMRLALDTRALATLGERAAEALRVWGAPLILMACLSRASIASPWPPTLLRRRRMFHVKHSFVRIRRAGRMPRPR